MQYSSSCINSTLLEHVEHRPLPIHILYPGGGAYFMNPPRCTLFGNAEIYMVMPDWGPGRLRPPLCFR